MAVIAIEVEAGLCLWLNDLECAREAVVGIGRALDQAESRGMVMAQWRVDQQLLSATVAARMGESPQEQAQEVIDATRVTPRTAWFGDGAHYSDAEALVLLGETDLALAALEETLLPDGGFLPLDSFSAPAERGVVLSEMDENPEFEDWKVRFRARREAMRERMIEIEASGEIPAPPGN